VRDLRGRGRAVPAVVAAEVLLARRDALVTDGDLARPAVGAEADRVDGVGGDDERDAERQPLGERLGLFR
jgi:hypothetical protein